MARDLLNCSARTHRGQRAGLRGRLRNGRFCCSVRALAGWQPALHFDCKTTPIWPRFHGCSTPFSPEDAMRHTTIVIFVLAGFPLVGCGGSDKGKDGAKGADKGGKPEVPAAAKEGDL